MSCTITDSRESKQPAMAGLKAVVLYEDMLTNEIGRDIAREFGDWDALRAELATWNAALLDESYFSDFIAGQLAVADVVVMALCGCDGFSRSLKRWVHRLSGHHQHQHPAIAVSLEETDRPGVAQVTRFMQETAQRNGLEFFEQRGNGHSFGNRTGQHDVFWLL